MENSIKYTLPDLNGRKLIFDTHAHYDDECFNEDRHKLLQSLNEELVCNIINAGTNLETCKMSINLAHEYDYIFASVGIHPEYSNNIPDNYIESLISYIDDEKVIAIGEIGLDYHYDVSQKQVQQKLFEEQLKLAKEFDLPVIIHDREAHLDTLNLLKKYQPKGVVHCFSGSVELAEEVIKLGMYIGLGGVVTFKNAAKALKVASSIPIDKLVLETDAPYMAPTPFRGKRCDSSMILYTASKISEVRKIKTITLLEQTVENAKKLFL